MVIKKVIEKLLLLLITKYPYLLENVIEANNIKARPEILTQEELNNYDDHLSLGKLRKFVNNNNDLPDSTKILIERIEDSYYKYNGWKVFQSDDSIDITEYHPARCIYRYRENIHINLNY